MQVVAGFLDQSLCPLGGRAQLGSVLTRRPVSSDSEALSIARILLTSGLQEEARMVLRARAMTWIGAGTARVKATQLLAQAGELLHVCAMLEKGLTSLLQTMASCPALFGDLSLVSATCKASHGVGEDIFPRLESDKSLLGKVDDEGAAGSSLPSPGQALDVQERSFNAALIEVSHLLVAATCPSLQEEIAAERGQATSPPPSAGSLEGQLMLRRRDLVYSLRCLTGVLTKHHEESEEDSAVEERDHRTRAFRRCASRLATILVPDESEADHEDEEESLVDAPIDRTDPSRPLLPARYGSCRIVA